MHKLISATCGKHIRILDTETDIWITRISVAALVCMHLDLAVVTCCVLKELLLDFNCFGYSYFSGS